MRSINQAAQAARERGMIKEVGLVWIGCRNRDDGQINPIGIWGGSVAEDILVRDLFTGVQHTRTFYTGLLEAPEPIHEVGLTVRPTTLTMSPLDVGVQVAFRERDPRGAKVQVWKRAYDIETRRPVDGLPESWFSGYVDSGTFDTPTPGGEASFVVDIVSTARMLTITSARRKSDQAQRARMGDRARRYKATAGEIDVPWGSEG